MALLQSVLFDFVFGSFLKMSRAPAPCTTNPFFPGSGLRCCAVPLTVQCGNAWLKG